MTIADSSDPTRVTLSAGTATGGLEIALGEVLGHTYEIQTFVAKGGMGTVYKARHVILDTEHAIKLILPELAGEPRLVEMMKSEAKTLREVRTEAIVEYQGLFYDENRRLYLVMEFVDGPSLATVLKDRALTPAEVRLLRNRLALGLAAAHDKGIYHRDLSPDNIILPQGRIENAKVIDFGIAKSAAASTGQTEIIFTGKYGFASPEQAGLYGGTVDGRTDIYSLGLVLAAAALGRGKRLDMGDTPYAMLNARQSVPDLSVLPAELRREIAQLLQPDPNDRPRTMRDIVATAEVAPRRSKAPLIAIALTALLALGLVGGHFLYPTALLSVLGTDTAMAAGDIRNSLADLSCSTLSVEVSQDAMFRTRARVTGTVQSANDRERINETLATKALAGFENQTDLVPFPFCEIINIVETLTRGAPPRVMTDPLVFREGEALQLAVAASPAFDGYLYIDLIDVDGSVVHMLPNAKRQSNKVGAGEELIVGAPKPAPGAPTPKEDAVYLVEPPLGTLAVLTISSRQPLFTPMREMSEAGEPYFAALRSALRDAGASASYRFIETAP